MLIEEVERIYKIWQEVEWVYIYSFCSFKIDETSKFPATPKLRCLYFHVSGDAETEMFVYFQIVGH